MKFLKTLLPLLILICLSCGWDKADARTFWKSPDGTIWYDRVGNDQIPFKIIPVHAGKLDKYGCHNNTALQRYQCHSGLLAGQDFANQAEMLVALAALTPPPPTTDPKDAEIATLKDQVAKLQTDLTALQSQIAVKDGAIATFDTQVKQLQTDLATLQGQVTTLQNQITVLNATIKDKDSQIATKDTQITTLQGQVTSLTTQLTSVQAELAACKVTSCVPTTPPPPTYTCQTPLGPCNSIDGHVYSLTQQDTIIGGYKWTVDGSASGCGDNAALRIGVDPYAGHIQVQQGPKHCNGLAGADAGHWYDVWNGVWTDITVTPPPTPPPTTGGITNEVGAATLAWEDGDMIDVLGFRVWYGQDPNAMLQYADAQMNRSIRIAGLESGKEYYFQVVAYGHGFDTLPSNQVNITVR